MAQNIKIENLAAAVMEELTAYSNEVSEDLKEAIKATAKECVADIKQAAPVRTKKYKKNWKTKVEYDSRTDTRVAIYNKDEYRLTHLLEYGHAKVGGGRVEGRPHIAPAEEKAARTLENKVKVVVKR